MFYAKCIAIFIGTLCYAVINNIPKRHLIFSALTGCAGYAVYLLFSPREILGCFMGAFVIAVMGEILSRKRRDAATLFIIQGIIPLVPGSKMFKMTQCLLAQDFSAAATWGVQVLLYAGGIAMAILLVSSTVRSMTRYLSRLNSGGYIKKN